MEDVEEQNVYGHLRGSQDHVALSIVGQAVHLGKDVCRGDKSQSCLPERLLNEEQNR